MNTELNKHYVGIGTNSGASISFFWNELVTCINIAKQQQLEIQNVVYFEHEI